MLLPLAVLDLVPIGAGSNAGQALSNTLALARRAEELGYTRYWLAEHHNTSGLASASPEITIALIGQVTKTMRVGAGGVMLPNHSPLKVAENFRMLEALYPGRVDLGLGRAPGTDQLTALALRRASERLGADDFPEQIQELEAYAGEAEFPEGLPFKGVIATPAGVPLPPIWLLSSSGYGARLAAIQGRGFAFAHHFSPGAARQSMNAYRNGFRPSRHRETPHAILTVSAICAETEERAEALARCVDLMWIRFHRGERGPLPTVEEAKAHRFTAQEKEEITATRGMLTAGTPDRVGAQLTALARDLQADELMISTHIGDHAERLRSYELLARELGATQRGASST